MFTSFTQRVHDRLLFAGAPAYAFSRIITCYYTSFVCPGASPDVIVCISSTCIYYRYYRYGAVLKGCSRTKSLISIKICSYAIEGSIGILHSQWDILQEHRSIRRHGKKDNCFKRRNSTSAISNLFLAFYFSSIDLLRPW